MELAIYKTMFGVGLPVIMRNLVYVTFLLVETLIAGQFGAVQVAAYGISYQIFFIINVTFFGIGNAASILISQYWGKKDIQSIKKLSNMIFTFGFIVVILFSAFVFSVPEKVLGFITNDEKVILAGKDYLKISSLFYIFSVFSFLIAQVLYSIEKAFPTFIASLISTAINLFFDFFFVFKLDLNLVGLAYAALIARIVEFLILWIYTIIKKLPVLLFPRISCLKDFWLIKSYLKLGFPLILNELVWVTSITAFYFIYARIGTEVVATMKMLESILNVGTTFMFGISMGVLVLTAKPLGNGETEKAFKYAQKAFIITTIFTIVPIIIILISSPFLISLYKVEETIKENVISLLKLWILFSPIVMFNTVNILGVLRAGGDILFVLLLDGVSMWLFGVVGVYLVGLVFKARIVYVYLVVLFTEVVKLILGYWRFKSQKWVKVLTR